MGAHLYDAWGKSYTDITRTRNAQDLNENIRAANRGGQIAHNARMELEKKTGEQVVSKGNYLHLTEKKKKQIESKK